MLNYNVVFLDIDGVVNTIQISRKPFADKGSGSICRNGLYFDICSTSDGRVSNEQAVMWLNKLCLETKAKIVISSTWRFHGLEECKKALYATGLDSNIEIIDSTPISCFSRIRGAEITKWINKNKENINQFVILDDDMDMGDLIDHLVKCDTYHGFGCLECEKAIEILKK